MKARNLGFLAIVILVSGLFAPATASAQDNTDYERLVTQTEFATGLVGAILGQVRTSIDDAEAMAVLKDKGVVPADWSGDDNVTMGVADQIFHQFGIRIEYESDEEAFLTLGVFEEILRHHLGEIKKTKHHWDIVHHFSIGMELGEYRQRLLGPSAENPTGISGGVVSPSGF